MGACLVNAFVEGYGGAAQGFQRHGSGQVEELVQAQRPKHGETAHRGHGLGSVEQRQALLGFEHQRSETGLAKRRTGRHPRALVKHFTFPDEHQGQMCQGSQIPTRSHRSPGWDHRMDAAVEQADEQLNQFVADAAQSFGEDVGAQQQHGPDLGLFQRVAHPAGVAAHQVSLQLLQVSCADAHIG